LDFAIKTSSKEMLQHEKRLADGINNVKKCWITALATTTTINSNTSSSSVQRDGTEQSLLKPVAKEEDVITTQNNRTCLYLIPN